MRQQLFKIFTATLMLLWCGLAACASFSGDICYEAHITKRNTTTVDEIFHAKFHVTRPNAKTCTAHTVVSQPNDGPAIFTGTCSIEGKIYLNLIETQKHSNEPWVDTEIFQVTLDKITLNGEFYQISHDFNTVTGAFDQQYAAGTFTKVDKKICAVIPPG